MFDLSSHLLEHRGVLPVPIIITEPAIGHGAGLLGVLFDQPLGQALSSSKGETGRAVPPNMTALGGFKTENGSWGALAGHHRTWNNDQWRYLGGLGKADMQFDYYGISGQPRGYRLDGIGLLQQLMMRAGDSNWFVGPRYVWLQAAPSFANGWPADLEGRPVPETRIGRLGLVVEHDTRDNIFTPRSGHFLEGEVVAARPALGGTTRYEQFNLRGFNWSPIGSSYVLGLRGDLQSTRGDVPFFALPYLKLRGLPALRYQDRNTAVAEAELWGQATPRWSLLGFVGAGRAWGRKQDFTEVNTVHAAGAGFRYLIAKQLGIHAGVDIARGPEETVLYLQVGSPWR